MAYKAGRGASGLQEEKQIEAKRRYAPLPTRGISDEVRDSCLRQVMTTRSQLSKPENDDGGHTALMVAALEGNTKEVKALLRQGGGVNAKDSMGRTALMFAVINMHYDTVRVLLESGADVNARSANGGTALMLAATSGEPRIVQALLDQGADTDATLLDTNISAMSLAVRHGYDAVISLLTRGGHEEGLDTTLPTD
jgi:ankyrin repeat protein